MILAAGAVLWRRTASGVELAVVHRPRYDDWSLPKGKLDRGESMPAAAVREVAEETGFRARLGPRLCDIHYEVPEGPKTVRFWAAEACAGAFEANEETDELRWCSPEQAARLLSYRRDLDVLARFVDIGVPDSLVLLVRHAKAGNRAQWDGHDDDRPLSGTGHEQARHLADLLPLYGPDRVASAPPVRCRATVAPLGMPVDDEPLLGEEGYWADPAAGLARFHELAARPGVTVICSQGGVIPDVVGTLTGADDVPSRKASTWVLGFTKGELTSSDHYARPTG
ncbi:NUDIX hydrolase [Pseudonocardia petroleophila]|uniref:NUDIX hydrolase n=1 Tax=Pseudonocardia petroleophila TaxID=37331 RepID=A0A7G7MQF1_9PSEU|nr:NUDIX hydrolase [Pseudonocardia petroleophila]QNG55012.1 NUDIX hydrolase [Pseudonocardia petroleophila]